MQVAAFIVKVDPRIDFVYLRPVYELKIFRVVDVMVPRLLFCLLLRLYKLQFLGNRVSSLVNLSLKLFFIDRMFDWLLSTTGECRSSQRSGETFC
jgi:hypothetical protein